MVIKIKMDDTWICIDDESISSNSGIYSDQIDSETEAELYNIVHHQENISLINSSTANVDNSQSSEFACQNINDVGDSFQYNDENVKVNCKNSLISIFQYDTNSEVKESFEKNQLFKQDVKQCSSPKNKLDPNSDSIVLNCDDSEKNGLKLSSKRSSHICELENVKKRSPKKPKLVKERKLIALESSDSDDSIIWTEFDSPVKSLATNMINIDNIPIPFDSYNDSPIISPLWSRNDIVMKNLSMPNIKIGESSKDLWYINDEDLYRTKKKSHHYHEKITSQCSNCNKRGHSSKMCPMPTVIKCFVCGGSHIGVECQNKICGRCYRFGHSGRNCSKNYTNACFLCKMGGHIQKDCPDIWRRYHLTTEPTTPRNVQGRLKKKQRKNLYCFNCGRPGHFGPVCTASKAKSTLYTWPAVLSYDDPEKWLNRRISNVADANFEINKQLNQNSPMNMSVNNMNSSGRQQQLNTIQSNGSQNQRGQFGTCKDFVMKRNGKRNKYNEIRHILHSNNVVREKNFPRIPRNVQELQNSHLEDPVPDYVNLNSKNRKRLKRNHKRRLRYYQKFLKADGEANMDKNLQNQV